MKQLILGLLLAAASAGVAKRCGVNTPPSPPPITPPPTTQPSPPPTTQPPGTLPSPPATPTPPPADRDDPIPPTTDIVPTPPSVYVNDVLAAMEAACHGCNDNDIIVDWISFQRDVKINLRAKGYIAAYDWDHGDVDPATGKRFDSELTVCTYRCESFQLVTSAHKVRLRVGAYTGAAKITGAQPPPPTPPPSPPSTPTPTPAPGPTPTPVPPPSSDDCPVQLPIPAGYLLALEIQGGGQRRDATPYITNAVQNPGTMPPPGWTGQCRGPHRCDIGREKDLIHGDICSRQLCGTTVNYTIVGDGFINWPFADGTRPDGESPYGVKFTMNSPTSTAKLTGTCPASGVSATIPVP